MNTERRFAVIIGINDYDNSPLDYCANDALSVAEILEQKCKFQKDDIYLIISTTKNPIKDISGHFEAAIKNVEKDFEKDKDSIFFYFAGHGEYNYDRSGLLFQDTLTEIPYIFNRINILQPKYQCYVIDACESGGKVLTRGRKELDLVEEFIAKSSGILFMYAATEKQNATESAKMNHGIFTYYFLDAINNKENYDKDGILTPNRIQDYIARETIKESKFTQTPVIESRTIGYYPFAFNIVKNDLLKKPKLNVGGTRKENSIDLPSKNADSLIDKQYFPAIPEEIRRVILSELSVPIDNVLKHWSDSIGEEAYTQTTGDGISIFSSKTVKQLEEGIVTAVERSSITPVSGLFSTRTIEVSNPDPYGMLAASSLITSMLRKEPTKYEVVKSIKWNDEMIICKSFLFESKDLFKVSFGGLITVYQSIYGIGLIFSSFHYDFNGYSDGRSIGLNSSVNGFKINPLTVGNICSTISKKLDVLLSSTVKWDLARKSEIDNFDKNSI